MTVREILKIKRIAQKHASFWEKFITVKLKDHLDDEVKSYTICWCWDYDIKENVKTNKHKHIDFNVDYVSYMDNFKKDEYGIMSSDETKGE